MASIKLKHALGNGTILNSPAANPSSDVTLKLPSTTGSAGQVLKVASANHSATNAELEFAGGGISNVVEDTSPQLGGDLDVNTKNIVFANANSVGNDDTLKFGDSAQFVFAFDGSHGRIDYTGTGSLQNKIKANSYFQVVNRDTGDNIIQAQAGGSLSLHNAGSQKLITTGSGVTVTGTVTETSDYRLKENEVAITDGITKVKTLKPYRYNLKAEPTETNIGFFAHEVAETVPEAVTGLKDAVDADNNPIHQGIAYSHMVPLLTAALQEAVAKIETLETEKTQMQTDLTALTARVTALEAA